MGEVYEINPGEKIRVAYPDIALTGAINTCMGIGILNVRKRIGYLAHQYNFVSDLALAIIQEALKESQSAKHLLICLAGNVPFEPEVIEDYRKHGRAVVELLLSNGIKKKQIQNKLVGKDTNESFEMTVDTTTNQITVVREDFYDEDESY